MHLNIGWLYPNLMSTYGDRGNVICLQRRCQWRGLEVNILPLDQETDIQYFHEFDLVVGGGAQDRQQEIVMRDLQGEKAEIITQKLHSGVPGVFTCGSPQLLGKYYEPALGKKIDGLGILDLVTKHPGQNVPRCIGNVAFEIAAPSLAEDIREMTGECPIVVGFENHGGRTYLGDVSPLGKVISGYGNNGEDGFEGAFYQSAIATYAHGPLLPKNPFLADWLIVRAIEQKYQQKINLSPLDDTLANQGRKAILKKLGLVGQA